MIEIASIILSIIVVSVLFGLTLEPLLREHQACRRGQPRDWEI